MYILFNVHGYDVYCGINVHSKDILDILKYKTSFMT